jgi:hypothetical protein
LKLRERLGSAPPQTNWSTRSIKTRIETNLWSFCHRDIIIEVPGPLKQGLKLTF